jgi:hypothetical protein
MIQWAGPFVRAGSSFDKLRTTGEGSALAVAFARKFCRKLLKSLKTGSDFASPEVRCRRGRGPLYFDAAVG